jgi:hypothetical protein
VIDAAAKYGDVSLNSKLLTGPDDLASLLGVLMKFRQRKNAVMADIQEMFSQVRVKRENQQAQRILWRSNPEDIAEIYIMQVMTFGATCSPACAQAVKNINAKKYTVECPEAVSAIITQMYVDDYLNSHNTVEHAIKVARDVIKINKDAGFNLRNFVSNSKDFLENMSIESIKPSVLVSMQEGNDRNEKALGLFWDVNSDQFLFKLKMPVSDKKFNEPTKRSVLKTVMKIFDILGLVSFVIIRAKVIIQKIWRTGTDWDEPINHNLQEEWKQWLASLSELEKISSKMLFVRKKNLC